MKISPLQLLRYVASETSCSGNGTFDNSKPFDPGEGQPELTVTVARQEKPQDFEGNFWAVEMTVAQTCKPGQNFPYNFKVSLLGFFALRDVKASLEWEERFVRDNGSSMLYGAAREIVRSMTSRGPWGALFLPSLTFYDPKPEGVKPTTAGA